LGRRAEICLTSREPHGAPDLNDPVNEYRQYRCIMRSNLGKLKLVLGCEIDSIDPNSKLPRPQNFVEIKTQRIITDQRGGENFRRNKLYKWWAQSFLGSVPRILVAFRNDKGHVTKLEMMKTSSLPSKAAQETDNWRPKVMTGFLERFLTFVKRTIRIEETTYIFEFEPHWENIKFSFDKDKNKEYYFIPEAYETLMKE